MSEKVVKIRVSVTMTKPYLDALDHLVEKGVYLSRGDIILEAIRRLLRSYEIAPFSPKSGEDEVD